MAVDLGWRRDATAIAVGHQESIHDTARLVVDRVETIRGTPQREVEVRAVEDRVHDLAVAYHHAPVVVDPAQMISTMQRLRARGVSVREHTFSAASNTRLALRLLELVRAHRIVLPDIDELVDEFCSVRITQRGPGTFRVDTTGAGHDDQVVAVGMLAVAFASTPIDTGPVESSAEILKVRIVDSPTSGARLWANLRN